LVLGREAFSISGNLGYDPRHGPRRACRSTIRPLVEGESGGYLIESPDLHGCMSDAATIEDVITNALNAIRGWIEAMRAEGHPIPAPTRSATASVPLTAP
jgi:predicted RNase H-like HicB family nuclease